MATSDELTLSEAFDQVTLTVGEASVLIQWLGNQFGDTDAGKRVRDAGAALVAPVAEPPTRSTSTTKSTSS